MNRVKVIVKSILIPTALLTILMLPLPVFAKLMTFTKEYTYQANDFDSRYSSRTVALQMVKMSLLEELGTYLVGETDVKNMQLTKDQITAYSAGIVSAEIVDEKWDGKTYWLKAKLSADPAEVVKELKRLAEDKVKAKQLEETKRMAEDLTRQVWRLKHDLALRTKASEYDDVAQEKDIQTYDKIVKGLKAVDWFITGCKAGVTGQSREAFNAFTNAIELNPEWATAYYNRGAAGMRNFQQAINDLTQVISENPGGPESYYTRGSEYFILNDWQRALEDYTKAIELKPDFPKYYMSRGLSYRALGDCGQAIDDFTSAIELKPDFAEAYYGRGLAYGAVGNYLHAIDDLRIAAKFNYKPAQQFLTDKGIQW